ncbi:ppdK [Symbiodinium sp. CCMP2456]|nr:ppdK [Symbiodinium sp. CCMP2456]
MLPWRPLELLLVFLALVDADVADDDLACAIETSEWKTYHAAYETAARATAIENSGERRAAAVGLAEQLLARTANVTEVLSCNVGVVAGYYILARLISPTAVDSLGFAGGAPEGLTGLAYRLLQLALVFIFTLRNANRIPEAPAKAWGVTEHHIIPAIMQMRRGHDQRLRREFRNLVPIAPSFRDPKLNIAVVSICAYPEDHPLALPRLTPSNREAYAEHHGYSLRLHLEHPIIGAHGLGVQHAKLATVLAYLQSNQYDWVAWLDCDSIIMNMNRTLDSVIYQYAQYRQGRGPDKEVAPVCGEGEDAEDLDLLTGKWLDSWVADEFREEGAIYISRESDSDEVQAEAQQIGHSGGRLVDGRLEMDFPGGSLQASIVWKDVEGSARQAEKLRWDNGAVWIHELEKRESQEPCREPCREPGPGCNGSLLDPEVNLLITEEGWGLSSANWIIRHSAWSMKFLHDALTAAHVELQLFGDQDAMILNLMNRQALEATQTGADAAELDPIDQHAAVVPQFELNAYDALNALTMDCDAFVEGDLLVTFPQCKDAEG